MKKMLINLSSNYSENHSKAIEFLKKIKAELNTIPEWESKLEEVGKEYGIEFLINYDKTTSEEITLNEIGYAEPLPDPMTAYLHEQNDFAGVKTAYDLGLVEEGEYKECCDYMRSLYPSEIKPLSLPVRPKLMDKFRTGR